MDEPTARLCESQAASPVLSPSLLSFETDEPRPDATSDASNGDDAQLRKRRALAAPSGRAPDVIDAPPPRPDELLASHAAVGDVEEYGHDERLLNEFLKLHPMLSLESTSARTLQLVHGLFERAIIAAPSPPLVPKSYDDSMLR